MSGVKYKTKKQGIVVHIYNNKQQANQLLKKHWSSIIWILINIGTIWTPYPISDS